MARVRVVNFNEVMHVENFKGDTLRIPAGGSIEMEEEDAILFKGNFRTPVKLKDGSQTLESMKKIRIEPILSADSLKEEKKPDPNVCHKCGFSAKSNAGLLAHIRANHIESMVDEDAKEAMQKGA